MLRISTVMTQHAEKMKGQVARLRIRSEKELATLTAPFQDRVRRILGILERKGWMPIVFHGERSKEEQEAKVKAGASQTMNSFHVVGSRIERSRNGIAYTIRGQAADIVDARYLWDGPCADLGHQFWKDLGDCAKLEGLVWGGDWKSFPDVAHVELRVVEVSQDLRGVRV